MFKITNLKSLTDELQCTQCNKLLSVLPVYYCSAVGNICGRCTTKLDWMIANGTLERAAAYESVAKYLIFPCSNKESGCGAKLRWNEVEEHEKSCVARNLSCPFDKNFGCENQCIWKGNMDDLVGHLQTDHKNSLQVSPFNFVLNTEEDNIQIFLTTVAEHTFIALTKYVKETNKFYCSAMCINKQPENQFYRYQLEIGRSNEYFFILRKNNTEEFVNVAEMIDNHDKMIAVEVTSVTAMLNSADGLIYCKIGIAKKGKKEVAAIIEQANPLEKPLDNNLSQSTKNLATSTASSHSSDDDAHSVKSSQSSNSFSKVPTKSQSTTSSQPAENPAEPSKPSRRRKKKNNPAENCVASNVSDKLQPFKRLSKMDKQLLEELECPVCSNHMIPPIYICPTGHSICSECKFKLQLCPSCRLGIMTTRNFTLERLTTKVPYPCKFMEQGCPEILTSETIHLHQLNCIYARNRCPLKMLIACEAKNEIPDVIRHIREKHFSYVVEANQEYARNLKAKITSSYYAAIYENEIFIVCCKHSDTTGPVKFNVLHVGMAFNQPKFRFELQFLDQSRKGMKLIINQLCQPLTQNPSSALKNCLAIPLEMLEPFISQQQQVPTLFFKFFIQRI